MVQAMPNIHSASCHIVAISGRLTTRAAIAAETSATAVEDKPSGLGLPADVALLKHTPAGLTYFVPHGAHQDGGWHRVLALRTSQQTDDTLEAVFRWHDPATAVGQLSFRRHWLAGNCGGTKASKTVRTSPWNVMMLRLWRSKICFINPYPTAFPYGNGMVLHFYQQQESSTTKTVHKVINKRLKAYV